MFSRPVGVLIALWFGLLGFVPVGWAQTVPRSVGVPVGETTTVKLPVRTSLEQWEAEVDSPEFVELLAVQRGDTLSPSTMSLRGKSPGTATVSVTRHMETALDRRKTLETQITLNVVESVSQQPDPATDTAEAPSEAPSPDGSTSQEGVVGEVRQLIRRERYDLARELINEELAGANDQVSRQLLELRAETYRKQENFGQVANTYQQLIDQYGGEMTQLWRVKRARALRRNDQLNEAELELIRVQFRHQDKPAWFDAMIEMSRLERDRGNPQAALKLLQQATERDPNKNRPDVWLELARVLDQESAVRDFERAYELYGELAKIIEPNDPEQAERIRTRRREIGRKYLDYGAD